MGERKTTTELAEARRLHAILREIFRGHTGDAADFRTLRRMLSLSQAAGDALDVPRTESLRQQALNALELLASRLYSLEAHHRATDEKGTLPWTTRAGIAPT